ncbi:MAG: hypothetical protein PHE56_15090, partial [Bacteroidales bacterium]|nr:hypothetical protein [Bacteroidales bacterium]
MKNQKLLLMLVLFGIATNLFSQTEQMKRWGFVNKQLNFSTNPPTINNLGSLTTGTYTKTGACNAFYDETNNMLFRIVDNKLFLPAGGNPVYTLYDPTSSDYAKMTGEIVMIPRTRTNCCEYYIFYTVFRKNYSGGTTTGWWEIRYAIFNIHTQNIVESDFVDTIFQGGTWSTLGPGGIVASDFIGTSDNFRFYAAFTAINGTTQNSEIVVNYYEISQRNMSLVQTRVVPTDDVSLISEVELSPNLDMLCVANANPNNNYTIANAFLWKINPTTGILGTTNNDWYKLCISAQTHQVVGCEFSHDGSKLLLASAGKGFYRYNTSSFNNINFDVSITHQNALKYTHSHIERTTYDTYYVASNDGKIGKLLFGSNYVNEECTIGTVELINNSLISDYSASAPDCFVLPEQIDGSTYLYTVGNEMDCCYAYNESAVKTTMTGVSHNSTTGDITIHPVTTSPYYVSWTQTSNPFTSGGVAITDVYLKGSLSIEPGARLNITGLTLHFKESEIVQMSYNPNGTGSRLFLYNSKLTAFDDCEEDNMWGGVRCSGNYAQAQGSYTTSKQPYTYMSNSTIEYATTGVEANTGGILRAYNSNFKDNIRDVKFASFTTNDNISEFGTCNFYTTEALYAKGFSPLYHAEIWTAPGVLFRACNFSNDYAASVPLSQWGVGILATSSSITVDEKCTNPFQQLGTPCPDPSSVRGSFTNLYYGIKANIGDFLTVSRQDFNNCLGGAWLIACDAIKV